VKIVMISDHETLGGAAVSTSRLAEALCKEHDVARIVLFPDGRSHPWQTFVVGTESSLARWARRVPRKLWPEKNPYPNTAAFVAHQLRRLLRELRPDAINLHNLHGGADQGWGVHMAAVCAEFAPVVWTLHDMWSFTGRCAYAYDCSKFVTGCDACCPTPLEPPRLAPERIAAAWDERRRLLAAHPHMVAVTPSRWLAVEARRGLWAQHRVEIIPYGVPTEVFVPTPRDEARRQLQVVCDGPIVLLAAHDLTERRKGAELLPQLWRHIRMRPLTVLTMGQGRLEIADPAIRTHSLGWIADDRTKGLAYSAADVLLHPAPVDNFPNVLLESFACGTPAVGLPIGGVPELMRVGVSGWLAAAVSAEALGQVIDQALALVDRGVDLRAACRALAEFEYPLAVQAQRFSRLLRSAVMAA
jgi:glycosyltransferase involved in cell wall biosynthesis